MNLVEFYETFVRTFGIYSALKVANSNILVGSAKVKVTLATLTDSSHIMVLSHDETLLVGTQAGSASRCL